MTPHDNNRFVPLFVIKGYWYLVVSIGKSRCLFWVLVRVGSHLKVKVAQLQGQGPYGAVVVSVTTTTTVAPKCLI